MKMESGAHAPKKKKNNQQTKLITIIAVVIIAIALVVGGIMIYNSTKGNVENPSSDVISSDVSSDTVSGDDTPSGDVSSEPDVFDDNGILAEFTDLYALNPDFIGRVYIPDTKLEQFVVQTKNEAKGKENTYYLDHNMYKEKDPYGTVFLDYQATIGTGFQSNFLTLYGHNSKDGGYFEGVKLYKDVEYYKENPILNFDTIYGKGQYKIIGYFTQYVFPDPDKHGDEFKFWYHQFVNEDEARFNEYMTELAKINYFESGVDAEFGDSIIALSTCNDEIQGPVNTPYRDVLVARKIRPGEEATIDVSKVKPNTDMVMPKGWVAKFGKENPYK